MISRNLPESRKKDKNNKVSIDGLKKSRAGKSSSVFSIKKETLLLEGEPSVDSRLLRGGYTPLPGGSHPLLPEYYGCYTPISGRFRRDPRLQVFFSFEEMSVPLVEMKILM